MPTIPSCPDADTLQRLVFGQLPDREALPLEKHLELCDRCIEALRTLQAGDPLAERLREGRMAAATLPRGQVVEDLISRLRAWQPARAALTDLSGRNGREEGSMPEGVANEYDRELVANTFPAGWQNPRPEGRYNLVVIGAGTAGLISAAGATGLGAKVALIEKHRFGGDCLNYGCVPSKALLRCARAVAEVNRADEFGVRVPGPVVVDFPSLMQRMRRLRAGISRHDSSERFRRLGVDVFLGEARFTGHDTVEVGGQTLRFARAVIATGARAARLDLPGVESLGPLTNETVFNLTELPRRLVIVGGGPIGCELAQAFRRFGSEVHLLNRSPGLLAREEPEASAVLRRQLERDGVQLHLGVRLLGGEQDGSQKYFTIEKEGRRIRLPLDALLVAVGRQANVENLGLATAGVDYDRDGVKVNDRLRTTNPRIFAAGDICSSFKFTHAADAMARIVLRNALFFGRARFSDLVIPWCTYTEPEVAHVGLTSRQCKERGIRVQSFRVELAEVDRAILDGETEGFAAVQVRQGSDRIVGATIVAANAGDMIGELALAMTRRLGLAALSQTIHAYPTQVEVLKRLGDAYQRSRLTPRKAGLLSWLLRWRR
jgi:pyruvate/2-oxoglutarate dehydrogenase complex dihydrolipoamide dehydrogenase (E3) component